MEGISLVGAVKEDGSPASSVAFYQDSNGDIDTLKITKNNVSISNIEFVAGDSVNGDTIIYVAGLNVNINNCTFSADTNINCLHFVGSGKISNCTF